MPTKTRKTTEFSELPILPVRDTVLFPNAILPLTVGRESSLKLVNELKEEERFIAVVAQRDPRVDNPQAVDLYQIGTAAYIHKIIKLPNQSLFVFVEGLQRIAVQEVVQQEPYLRAHVKHLQDLLPAEKGADFEALVRSVMSLFQQVVQLSPTLSDDLQTVVMNIDDPGRLTDFIAANLPSLSSTERQELLESLELKGRLERLNRVLAREVEVLQLRSKIQSDVQDQVTQSQREYYLREQMKAIQKELGEADEQQEIEELRKKIEAAGMTEEAKKEAMRELSRLAKMSPAAADYHVTRTYLDWLVVLPWSKVSEFKVDLRKAKEILDTDHYDLEKVKERILDYLAVLQLKPQLKGPILCFVGPPGVGKTSLGKSIARALDRKFVRMSLGGIHDEAEIRGHRRTYIGALPGQIIQGIRRRPATRSSCSTRWTRSAATSAATPLPLSSKCSTRSRTPISATTTWTCNSTFPGCCSSPPPTCWTRFLLRCSTAWRFWTCRDTPKKKRSRSPSATSFPSRPTSTASRARSR